jgi:hypothetical protein
MMAILLVVKWKIQNSTFNIQNLPAASALSHPLSGRLACAPTV